MILCRQIHEQDGISSIPIRSSVEHGESTFLLVEFYRRLAACRLLGWEDVPVSIVSLDDIVRGENDENAIRKDFLPSEIDSIRRALEPKQKEAAKARCNLARPIPKPNPDPVNNCDGKSDGPSDKEPPLLVIETGVQVLEPSAKPDRRQPNI